MKMLQSLAIPAASDRESIRFGHTELPTVSHKPRELQVPQVLPLKLIRSMSI